MRHPYAAALAALTLACATVPAAAAAADNPLLHEWTGPYGGVPPFDRVKVEHFRPGLEAALQRTRQEVARIADAGEPPTFQNTIEALEDAGRLLDADRTLFGVFTSTLASPEIQAIDLETAPRVSALFDEVNQNEKLFRRVEA